MGIIRTGDQFWRVNDLDQELVYTFVGVDSSNPICPIVVSAEHLNGDINVTLEWLFVT